MKSLSINQLSVTVQKKQLLNNINFSLEPGDICAVIGPNGAGKSSLLNAIAEQHKHPKKTVQLFNAEASCKQPLHPNDIKNIATQFAYLEQANTLDFPLNVSEVIALGRIPHSTGITQDEDIINKMIVRFDLTTLTNKSYLSLSGGEQQRVHLARIFTQIYSSNEDYAHTLSLLDEPTNALDIEHKHQLMSYILRLQARGHTSILCLHDLNFAARYCNKLLILKKSEQIAFGCTKSIFNESLLSDVFNHKIKITNDTKTNELFVHS